MKLFLWFLVCANGMALGYNLAQGPLWLSAVCMFGLVHSIFNLAWYNATESQN